MSGTIGKRSCSSVGADVEPRLSTAESLRGHKAVPCETPASPLLQNEMRRRLLQSGAGLALAGLCLPNQVLAQSAKEPVVDAYVPREKYALLIGNREYPNRKEIAPAHKNVSDVKDVLEYYEFKV
ncbi:MAG: hypothetical protein KA388_06860, partial [Rhodocyclaceae bacterium]|nr:hypothetical protein [Rhodocyclaceae bacterium]MBP6279468.1 hypothetical protein [Rhodocyclaceae bacterium]